MYRLADSFALDPKVRPPDFYETLGSLDTALSVFHRLDRARVEAIECSRRPLFLSRYLSAAVTGMAREAGILRGLETTGLVRFREPGARAHEDGYLEDTPELAPVLCEFPYFGSHFLGMLQQELEALIAAGGPDSRAMGGLDPEKLFGATRGAIGAYFLKVSGGKDRETVDVLADAGCPFVFLWLCSIGLLDDMVNGLLDGKPLLRRAGGDGKEGQNGFVPAGDGPDAQLFRLVNEED